MIAAAVLFTDIDGTLIDHDTYRPGPAAGALVDLQNAGVMVVLCSSKTAAEQVVLRAELGLEGPYIVENGAAVLGIDPPLQLGLAYEEVRSGLRAAAAAASVVVRGYGDMTPDEIAARTGLDPAAAERAKGRSFSETFVIEDGGRRNGEAALARAMAERGLRMLRGARFLTAAGSHDKGTAVRALAARWGSGACRTYGIGDYHNDVDMLAAVDVPMLVQRPGGEWADLDLGGLIRLRGIGPEGWVLGAHRVLAEL
jgi:mannosyl-3-phosphoglycerate phosphatase